MPIFSNTIIFVKDMEHTLDLVPDLPGWEKIMKKMLCVFWTILVCIAGVSSPLFAADDARVLKVVSPWKAKGMDMAKSGYVFARMGCTETLTTTDGAGRMTGHLAKSWQVAKDGVSWTFMLRPGVVFHDQTPLTAEAAAHSLNIALKSGGPLSKARIEKIAPSGPMSLEIVTTEPFSALPAYLAHYSNGIVSKASFDENGKFKTILGTGQYKLASHEGETLFRFEANSDYWGGAPEIGKTEYHAVPKGETRGFMIKAGQAEMIFTLSPMDAKALQNNGDVVLTTLSIPRTRLMVLNCGLPIFSDPKVRRAISLAIDRGGIAAALLRNPPSAAAQLLPPTASMWHDPDLAALSYDPGKAAALLAQAGWKPGKDGILAKDGNRFSFELITYGARPMLPPIATAVQDQLKKIGIEMEIRVVESSVIPEKHNDGTLQAALIARNYGQIPDAVGTIYGDYGPKPGAWGSLGWQSESLNKALSQYLATFDPKQSQQLRKEVLDILQKELPVIPITWNEHIVAYSSKLEGVDIDPFELKSYVKGVRWRQ